MPHHDGKNVPPNLPSAPLCCLVVEDNLFALDIMTIFLKRHGFSVDGAENGKIGLDKYLADPQRYSIIFMDLQMPVMNGYEATRIIRTSDCPGAKKIPIIAMSGDPLHDLHTLGFSYQLTKPFDLQMVLGVFHKFLSHDSM